MLAKRFRLVKRGDFERLKGVGRTLNSPFFKLRFVPNNRASSRFGIIISAKVSKKATKRNWIKRQLTEEIRLNLDKIKPGYDIVFIVFAKAVGASPEELRSQANQNLAKIK